MYLKEIKTSGFKSFADKINLTLDEDITCIVGPNGSGKSNIVDAVKWVLGEQSVKTLRGDNNMTDVIFSGSKSRKPLNLASVSLVFDNSDGYLKVPYTEISITRKVFRSGENEYYINNEKCRLKDINDLFLDSGMGKYAFNIISQGEVTDIINNSPYDRRSLIEEAAGVLKYKKRKEEALRKLSKTNENLVRIKDIMAELETRIEPLKVQRDDALKYKEYEGKLKDIEVAIIASDLEKLEFEFKNNEKLISELEEKIASELTSSSKKDTEVELLKKEKVELEEKLNEINNKYIDLTKDIEKLNGEKNIIKERSKYETDDIKVYENISRLTENKKSLEVKISSLEEDLKVLEEKVKSNAKSLEEEKKRLNDITSIIENKNTLFSKKEKRLNDIEYKIKYLENYIEQGSYMNPNVKRVLTNPKLSGIHNTISNLLETDDAYSLALSVSLGGAKDYVVVDTPESAKKAINYLKDNGLGRVTFYPLSVIKERSVERSVLDEIKLIPGFIGVFSGLVDFNDKYENIIKNVLGSVLLVDTIDTANKIRNLTNNRYKIVTLTGEVINIGGSITGGKVKTNSVITEKYELKQNINEKEVISKEIENLKEELAQDEDDQNNISSKVLYYERNNLVFEEEKKVKESNIEKLKDELKNITFEISNLEGISKNTIKDEEKRIIEKLYEMEEEKEKLEKHKILNSEKKEEIDKKLEELEASFKYSNSNVRDLENKLKDYEINNSKNGVKMDNLLEYLSEEYGMTYEHARANFVLDIDESLARKNIKEYKKALGEIETVNLSAIDEYDRVSTRYEFLKKQSSDLEDAESTLLKIIDELDAVMKDEFETTFIKVQKEFDKVFKELFGGGTASLELTDPDNLLTTGVIINASPPGKKLRSITLLSGGEKTLTAISLLFAILNLKKIPFCLFDEIEAALDEANVDKVGTYFKKYSGRTQLIIITHKKKTMEYANNLYGITMQESGVSKLVSVKLV